MSSSAQTAANRRNAAQSTGPRTETGKQRTRLNGLRHGLTGQTVVMPGEDQTVYLEFRDRTVAGLQPLGEAELALAQTIADDNWRLNRARAIEENIFALGLDEMNDGEDPELQNALSQAATFLDHAREIQLLSLYAGRIARAIAKNTTELKALQDARRQAREAAFEQAMLLFRLARSQGRICNSAKDFTEIGFAFSPEEIERAVLRQDRLEEARALAKKLRRAA